MGRLGKLSHLMFLLGDLKACHKNTELGETLQLPLANSTRSLGLFRGEHVGIVGLL